MISFKKYLAHLLAVVLFVSLLGGVFALSLNNTFSKPDNVKTWLKESKFYDNFVTYVIDQGEKSSNNADGQAEASDNPAIIQAAKTAFPPQFLEDSTNKFLDGNYAWLQGKTDKPAFTIDLAQPKEVFAQELGKEAAKRFTTLPACTPADIAQFQEASLLEVTCQPVGVSADFVNQQVADKTRSGEYFFKEVVITPETIGQLNGAEEQPQIQTQQTPDEPYYANLSQAPTLYKIGQLVPLIAAALALLSLAGVIFLPERKRTGLKSVAVVLAIAGFILVVIKVVADSLFAKLENTIVDASSTGQLQQSFVEVLRKAEGHLVAFNMIFGAAFLIVAAGILIYLHKTRAPKPASALPAMSSESPISPTPPTDSTQNPQ